MVTLSLLPLLVMCDTFATGFAMALLVALLLPLACLAVFALRRLIPAAARVVWLLLVSVTLTLLLEMLLQAVAYDVSSRLGVYISLAAFNCLVLFEMEGALLAPGWAPVARRALALGIVAALVLVAMAGAREMLVAAGLTLFAAAPGVLLLAGLAAAVFAAIRGRRERWSRQPPAAPDPVDAGTAER